mgnify:CR=1 FL=1
MGRLDRWSACFWFGISVAICIHSVSLGVGSFREPGVGFLFFWGGVTLAFLSLLLLLKSRQEIRRADTRSPWIPFREIRWLKVAAVLAALGVYALFFEWLGALISTALFIGFLMQAIEPKRWYIALSVSIVSTLSIYLLFKVILNVRLPLGILGF